MINGMLRNMVHHSLDIEQRKGLYVWRARGMDFLILVTLTQLSRRL